MSNKLLLGTPYIVDASNNIVGGQRWDSIYQR